VERRRAQEKVWETMRQALTNDKMEGKKDSGHPEKDTEQPRPAGNSERNSPWRQPGRWVTKEVPLKGIPMQEHKEYFRSLESC